MPCRDYYDDHPDAYYRDVTLPGLKAQISFAESALCAALRAMEKEFGNDFYNKIDYTFAGITKPQLKSWHKTHKELDAKHREAARLDELKKTALDKLTPEEKVALGFK
jgi:hypothetical protein